jgi:hypothetical protein
MTEEQPAVGEQLTPLLASTLSSPRWFTGTDGKAHLVYELLLTNVIPAGVTVNAVEVHDADSGALLTRLTGDALLAATSLAASADTPTTTLPSSSLGVVWLDIVLGSAGVPSAVTHRIAVDPPAGVPTSGIGWTFSTRAVEAHQEPPVAIAAPLTGPKWVALGSCCDGPHRRAPYPVDGRWYLAQRFAIDFNQLDPQDRPGVGDPLSPSSFPTFGQPVYAVADGTVVAAEDGNPDLPVNAARADPTPETAGGNRVAIDIGGGRFAVYAHLHKDSTLVQVGDKVTRGRHIADVGSSGTGGGPHLHFQIVDHPSVVVADGLPFVFDEFDLTGRTPPLPEVLKRYETLERIPLRANDVGPRHDQLPLGRDVMTFPAPDRGRRRGRARICLSGRRRLGRSVRAVR